MDSTSQPGTATISALTEEFVQGFFVVVCSENKRCFHEMVLRQDYVSKNISVDVPLTDGDYILFVFALELESSLPHGGPAVISIPFSISGAPGIYYSGIVWFW